MIIQNFLDRCFKRKYALTRMDIRDPLEKADRKLFKIRSVDTDCPLIKIIPKKKETKSREYEMRELIPHIGLIPRIVLLKLFLDMVPSSPTDANARCVDAAHLFLRDDRKRNGRKCDVKEACIHFVDVLSICNRMGPRAIKD